MLGIFRRKQQTAKTWQDIPLRVFNDIAAITKDDEGAKALRIARAVYGEQGGSIDFVNTDCPKNRTRKRYWIAGKQYYLQGDLQRLTMSQYIDATNARTTAELLSVLLIPCGRGYNDGYDLNDVKKAMLEISTPDALGISFFLAEKVRDFVTSTRKCLQRQALTQPAETASLRYLITYLTSMERLITLRLL